MPDFRKKNIAAEGRGYADLEAPRGELALLADGVSGIMNASFKRVTDGIEARPYESCLG